MYKLVLLRHGLIDWNIQNRFTGWQDVDLPPEGIQEAHKGGQSLHDAGFKFDIAYTSLLKRAIRTLWIVLDQLDQMWIPVIRNWRLNERFYGALQGLKDTIKRVVECWNQTISKDILTGKKVLITAHGNSLRALVQYLDQVDTQEILKLNIPTGIPLIYDLGAHLKPKKHYYLTKKKF